MSLAQQLDEEYNYAQYLTWTNPEERWEIIDGIVYDMSPAPVRKHQKILVELTGQLYNYFKGKSCELYVAPFDVRFSEPGTKDEEIKTVVQPDIAIVCDPDKLDERGCIGAPDLIVEILSPSTAAKDVKVKYALYEKSGVKEYWIVHPDEGILEIFVLGADGKYGKPDIYTTGDKFQVKLFEGLEVEFGELE